MPKIMMKFERDHPLRGRQMQVGWVKIGHVRRKTRYNLTSGSAIAEGPRDVLVSRNSATTEYRYRAALFV